jgi:hypothetical protein
MGVWRANNAKTNSSFLSENVRIHCVTAVDLSKKSKHIFVRAIGRITPILE